MINIIDGALREEPCQINVILQQKLPAATMSAVNEYIIVQRLVRTDKWMIEYLIVKKYSLPLCHQFDTSVCQYIKTHKINQNN